MDVNEILARHIAGNDALLATVTLHSGCVAGKALSCACRKGIDIDRNFVYEAAMLHDIGVVRCDAPSIFCHGSLPYICHGIAGRKILEGEGLHSHALVCERHTGSGLTVEDIVRQNLPLPHRDMLPISLEEKLICYADKFFSKSGNLTEEKDVNTVINLMKRHGQDTLERFLELHRMFS